MQNERIDGELKLEVLDPREEMEIINCKWDGNPDTQTCWLGDQPGPG